LNEDEGERGPVKRTPGRVVRISLQTYHSNSITQERAIHSGSVTQARIGSASRKTARLEGTAPPRPPRMLGKEGRPNPKNPACTGEAPSLVLVSLLCNSNAAEKGQITGAAPLIPQRPNSLIISADLLRSRQVRQVSPFEPSTAPYHVHNPSPHPIQCKKNAMLSSSSILLPSPPSQSGIVSRGRSPAH
jgi:hypothetical protein